MADLVNHTSEEWLGNLSRYHDNDLPLETRLQIETHIQGCGSCSQVLRQYESIYGALRESPGFSGQIELRLPQAPLPIFLKRPQPIYRSVMIAVSIVAAFALLIVSVQNMRQRNITSLANSVHIGSTNPSAFGAAGAQTYTKCANTVSGAMMRYYYAGRDGSLWSVNGCSKPAFIANIQPVNFHLGDWSPDNRYIIIFAPDTAYRAYSQLIIWDSQTNTEVAIPLVTNLGRKLQSISQAKWLNSDTMAILADNMLFTYKIGSKPALVYTPNSGFTISQIDVAQGALYFSVYDSASLQILAYSLPAETVSPIENLLNATPESESCQTCGETVSWSISPSAELLAMAIQTSTGTNLKIVPIAIQNTTVYANKSSQFYNVFLPQVSGSFIVKFSPDGSYVAALVKNATNTVGRLEILQVNNMSNVVLIEVLNVYNYFSWRADSNGIVIEPMEQDAYQTPYVIDPSSGKILLGLDQLTSDYVWLH